MSTAYNRVNVRYDSVVWLLADFFRQAGHVVQAEPTLILRDTPPAREFAEFVANRRAGAGVVPDTIWSAKAGDPLSALDVKTMYPGWEPIHALSPGDLRGGACACQFGPGDVPRQGEEAGRQVQQHGGQRHRACAAMHHHAWRRAGAGGRMNLFRCICLENP